MIKCPKCGKKVEEWANECPYCKTDFEKYDRGETTNRNNADWLNIFAVINIILCIIASIIIFVNYSTMEVIESYEYISGTHTETVINWIGIVGGIATLLFGFTQYFMLETIIDIHDLAEETSHS